MKLLEEILYNVFNKTTSEVPPEIDVDELWKDIENNLPTVKRKPFWKNINFTKGALLLILLFSLGIWTYYSGFIGHEDKQLKINESIVGNNTSITEEITEKIATPSFSENKINKTSPIASSESHITTGNKTADLNSNSFKAAETKTSVNNKIQKNPDSRISLNEQKNQITNVLNQNDKISSRSNNEEVNAKIDEKINLKKDDTQKELINSLHYLPILNPSIISTKNTSLNKISDLPILVKKKKTNHFALTTYFGFNTFKNIVRPNSGEGSLAKTLNKSNQVELGFSSAIEIEYHFDKRFYLSSGIAVHHVENEFNFREQTPTLAPRNEFPNSPPVSAIEVKNIKYDNYFRYYSVPFLIGIKKRVGFAKFGLGAGFGLNYFTKQDGISLNSDNIITTFSDDEENKPYSKFFVSYHIKPYLESHISKQLALRLRANLDYQRHKQSPLHNLNQHSIRMGLDVGLVYYPLF